MVQAVRGMRDILPAEARRWRLIENTIQAVLRDFAYEEVQLPLLEFTELFARGVGEATDIVEKEMYSLLDRDGDSLSLRPEGTASCVRALSEHGLLFNQTQRVFYSGSMFRYEKPQKGRYRQFNQIGAEAFGFNGPDLDAELILLGAQFWQALGIEDNIRLEINTLGDSGARQAYREALLSFLTPLKAELDEDSQRRLATNPMRILDSKNAHTQSLLRQAPRLQDFIDDDSQAHFQTLLSMLDDLGIAYICNENLVRGLDYYTHTVFEWTTDDLGSQGAVCGGGRYNGLVERLGGKSTPAAGFAVGLDRVALLHEVVHQTVLAGPVDVYVCYADEQGGRQAQVVGQRLRQALSEHATGPANGGHKVRVHMGGGNLKKQLKRANQCGAAWTVLIEADAVAEGQLALKHMATGEQESLSELDLVARIRNSSQA